jgi:hypothetical protein
MGWNLSRHTVVTQLKFWPAISCDRDLTFECQVDEASEMIIAKSSPSDEMTEVKATAARARQGVVSERGPMVLLASLLLSAVALAVAWLVAG